MKSKVQTESVATSHDSNTNKENQRCKPQHRQTKADAATGAPMWRPSSPTCANTNRALSTRDIHRRQRTSDTTHNKPRNPQQQTHTPPHNAPARARGGAHQWSAHSKLTLGICAQKGQVQHARGCVPVKIPAARERLAHPPHWRQENPG